MRRSTADERMRVSEGTHGFPFEPLALHSPPVQFRQGDVLLQAVASVPDDAKGTWASSQRLILALGELTGHAHVLATAREILETESRGERFVTLSGEGVLTHEEHATIAVPAGSYQVIRQREYRPRPQTTSATRTAWVVE